MKSSYNGVHMNLIEKYLVIINIVGFLLYFVNFLLYRFTESANIDKTLTFISLVGGSLGIFVFILFFDRKTVKGNMMSRVFLSCVLVIQIVMLLFYEGVHREQLTFAFDDFFSQHNFLVKYLIVLNVISFVAFAIDKLNAIKGRSRIRILTLLGLAFAGGSIGSLFGMYLFRHKIRKDYFAVGIPLIIVMQIVVIFYLMNL